LNERIEMEKRPYVAVAGSVRLAVRVKPRASHNGIGGIVTGADGRTALLIRLTVLPVGAQPMRH
jgi:uncharacterized protein YggU (UPF0235/DUF167 family)